MNDEAHDDLTALDTVYWINTENIVNENGKEITFDNHFFLLDLYLDKADKIVVRKPAQIGVSTWAILRSLHSARYQGINQIHTLPTGEDVNKFVPSKTNQIIKNNECLSQKISSKDADSVGQKQFGKSFLFYKGTHSERESIMLTSDRNIYDEYDRSNMDNIKNYHSRLEGAESMGQEWFISTPTIPNFGVDYQWNKSDQKHWRFNCPACKAEQHFLWPDSVDFVNKRYVCLKCGKPIDKKTVRQGEWKAKYPDRNMSGYWLNQMIVPWKTAGDVIEEYEEAEENGELDYFYNFKMGMPYMNADTQIPASLVLKNLLTGKEVAETNSCMGVDVQGNELYVIIGNEEAIFVIARIPDKPRKTKWERLAELVEIYDVRYGVIDAGFKPNDVLEFAKKFPYKIFMNWYKPDPKKAKIVRYNDKGFTSKGPDTFAEEIKVLTDRERAIDAIVAWHKNGKVRYNYGRGDENIQMLIKHMETMYARTIETKLGETRREWASTGKNDLVHALVYWWVAMHRKNVYEGN